MALPQEYLPVVSSEAYLRFERDSETRHEFLDGVVYAMAGETPDHSRICFNLITITGSQIRDKPCQGFSPNMKVRAGLGGLYAYPDLMIVCGEAKFHDQHGDVLLNPLVMFEVLSPSTERYDRGEKFRLEHHHRQTDGKWSATEISGLDGVLVLPSIDCRIPLAEVYRHTKVGT
ncbi:MAG: hypothetical protein DMF76_25070 [Acidobacteria bacterium]|nr:MAG: hypothetical protein DMF76_25070 [Acidobacteriota bacterium]